MGPLYYEDWHTRKAPITWTWDLPMQEKIEYLYDYLLHLLNYLLLCLGDRIVAITGGELMVMILVPFLIFTALDHWKPRILYGRSKTL
jgi:hypothetical protein